MPLFSVPRPSRICCLDVLPAELWLVVFEWVLASSLEPEKLCNSNTFPSIALRLHDPWTYGPATNPPLRDLRLVCRAFHALLAPSTPLHCFMTNKDTLIPPQTKALHIASGKDANLCLKRLVEMPEIYRQLVTLELLPHYYGVSPSSSALLLDLHHQNDQVFQCVRNLTLGFFSDIYWSARIAKFWERLNRAFPNLVCLALLGYIGSEDDDLAVITFEKLEIFDTEVLRPRDGIRFPALRHLSCGSNNYLLSWITWSLSETSFTCSSQMESLLLRRCRPEWEVDWMALPRLRFLGLPITTIGRFNPLPPEHPLEHLYVIFDIGSRGDREFCHETNPKGQGLFWVQRILTYFPNIQKITLAFETHEPGGYCVPGRFDRGALAPMGWFAHDFVSYGKGYRRVLKRLPAYPPPKMLLDGRDKSRRTARVSSSAQGGG